MEGADFVTLLAWRCPVCGRFVGHPSHEEGSRLGARRRCPVCKLVLVFDGPSNQMMVAPFDAAEEQTSHHDKNLHDAHRPLWDRLVAELPASSVPR
jgi:hypothetical protein